MLIEVDPGYTAKVLLEDLCGKLSVNVRGNLHELLEAVINKLQDSGRLIIIDEAELLPYRALEVIRRIHDKTGIGIVLAGMPRPISANCYNPIFPHCRMNTMKSQSSSSNSSAKSG